MTAKGSPVAAFALGIFTLSAVVASDAQAADRASKTDDSAVQQASYSTGSGGARLKWTAQKPVANKEIIQTSAEQPNSDSCGGLFGRAFGRSRAESHETNEDSCQVRMVQDQQPVQGKAYQGELLRPAPEPSDTLDGDSRSIKSRADKSRLSHDLNKALGRREFSLNQGCPSPKDLKPIIELGTNLAPSAGDLPRDCPLGNDQFEERSFAPITFTWTASALCHKPLYFEDVQLERYGHMAGPWVQPMASAVNFFLTFPILPYKMGLETPNECMYTLGYYRPGSCAPYLFDPLPLSVRATVFEAGAWVGACAALP